jgi:predicted Zn-dependent protease
MPVTPNALCFGEEFPATGAPCHVEVLTGGLMVRVEDVSGHVQEDEIPFAAVRISAGGVNHDHLVVKWEFGSGARTLYLKDSTLLSAFRHAAPYEILRELEETAAKVRRVRSRRRAIWLVVATMLCSVAFFFWFASDLLVDFAVSRIPLEWEQKLGESAYRDFLAQQTVITEGPAIAAVKEITHRLTDSVPDNPYTFEVSLVKSDVVNAFALPGGYVVVFTGLMLKAESGEEVAGVLSHELNHVLRRHGLERIVKQIGLVAVLTILLGDPQGLAGLMKQLGVELLTLKFGRAQETEADLLGVQLLHRAKIDPSGMIRFFERLAQQDKDRVEILSTHPMSDDRAERLKAEVATLSKNQPEPFKFDWTAVRRSLGVQD